MVKQLDESKKVVKKASKVMSPVEHYKCLPAKLQTSDGEELKLEFYWATHLNEAQCAWIFDLFDRNMQEMYRQSEWGYEENSKKSELFATTSRYIVVRTAAGKHVAFLHYRFVVEVNQAVLYVYELQVDKKFQNKGIGSLLLRIVEQVAKKSNMQKLYATVFTFNHTSLAFFKKNGFQADEHYEDVENEHDYFILSKKTSVVSD